MTKFCVADCEVHAFLDPSDGRSLVHMDLTSANVMWDPQTLKLHLGQPKGNRTWRTSLWVLLAWLTLLEVFDLAYFNGFWWISLGILLRSWCFFAEITSHDEWLVMANSDGNWPFSTQLVDPVKRLISSPVCIPEARSTWLHGFLELRFLEPPWEDGHWYPGHDHWGGQWVRPAMSSGWGRWSTSAKWFFVPPWSPWKLEWVVTAPGRQKTIRFGSHPAVEPKSLAHVFLTGAALVVPCEVV